MTESEGSENQKLEPLSEVLSSLPKTIQTTQTIQTHQTAKRDEAIDKLEEAGVPIDDDVIDAVRSHHISQVLKAAAIIKDKDCNRPLGLLHPNFSPNIRY